MARGSITGDGLRARDELSLTKTQDRCAAVPNMFDSLGVQVPCPAGGGEGLEKRKGVVARRV